MDRPLDNSYWVVPGKLLAGEYPGARRSEEAKARVDALLRARVGAFIDLTETGELEPYSEWAAPALHHRFPIEDVSVPSSTGQMIQILDTIDEYMDKGELVYVHCWGGVGRTGVTIGCWLARRHGGEKALRMLRELWKECPKSAYWRSPETREQEQYVTSWPAGS